MKKPQYIVMTVPMEIVFELDEDSEVMPSNEMVLELAEGCALFDIDSEFSSIKEGQIIQQEVDWSKANFRFEE